MKIEVGILKSKIITDNKKLLAKLQQLYSFPVDGSFFSTAYKRGHWDGKKHFIGSTGIFKTGLLDSILTTLKKIECTPELIYSEPSITGNEEYDTFGFSLYKYQKELIDESIKQKRAVIKLPTGGGKTLIMACLVSAFYKPGRKMVILVNAKQLLFQTYKFLTEICKFKNIGLCFGEGFENGDIMICTVQSIDKIFDTHLDVAECLFVDEIHEFANGKITLAAIESFPKASVRFGFSATPSTKPVPKYNIIGAIGPIIEKATTNQLIEGGTLTKPKIIIHTIDPEKNLSSLSYQEVYEHFIVNNLHRNRLIADIVASILSSKSAPRIVILVKDLAHADNLEKLIPNSFKLWGDDDLGTRYKVINKFITNPNGAVLIGTKILQTGINIEEITDLINARGLKSEQATIQALGRALRLHESKSLVHVYDFIDNAPYLIGHSNLRIKHYNNEQHEIIYETKK